jgi:DNA-binding MarR family transcriptional regulator
MTPNTAQIVRELEGQGIRLPRLRLNPQICAPAVEARKPRPKLEEVRQKAATRRKKIAVLWRKGTKAKDIALRLAIPVGTVASDIAGLQAAGLVERRIAPAEKLAERRAQIVDLWAAGRTIAYIAAHLGLKSGCIVNDIYVLQSQGEIRPRHDAVYKRRAVRQAAARAATSGAAIAEAITKIVAAVAAEHRVSMAEILQPASANVAARREACWRANQEGYSLGEIGNVLNCESTAVLRAINLMQIKRSAEAAE